MPSPRLSSSLLSLALLAAPGLAATEWFDGSYNQALRAARTDERPVLMVFVSPESDYSRALEEETLVADAVAEALADHVLLRVDTASPEGQQIVQLHNVADLPALLFLDDGGKVEEKIAGYIPAEPLLYELERIARRDQTVSMFRDAVREDGDDLQARYELANKLQWVGDQRGHDREIATIRERDPRHESRPGALLHLYDLMWDVIGEEQHGGAFDVTPVAGFLAETRHEPVRFQGWNWVANSLGERERHSEGIDAFRKAFAARGEDDGAAQWCHEVANLVMEGGDELADEQRAFALELAVAATRAACGDAPQCDEGGAVVAGAGDSFVAAYAEAEARGEEADGYGKWIAGFMKTLARAQQLNGDVDAAKASYGRCQELDPAHAEHYAEAVAALGPAPRQRRR